MSLVAGTTLGAYEIVGLLGAGGMGEVYKGRDTRLGRTVAIKVLPAEVAADPDRRKRFEREARAVSALNHPHICVLLDIGSTSTSRSAGGNVDYLVMEYLEGQTLAERLAKGPLPLAQALDCAIQIADALAAVHRSGIVHGDLKPGNVMITKSGVKLLDFGLARLTQTAGGDSVASGTLTASGTIVGTVPYMAPEQVQGLATDARTDIFAFGAVLYEMVTGKRAFDGSSPASVAAAILEREPPPVSSLQPPAPPGLDRLVRRCLAKAPDDRPDTAHDLASDLRWLQEPLGSGTAAANIPSAKRRARASLLLIAGIALGVFVGAALAARLFSREPSSIAADRLVVRSSLPLTDGSDIGAPADVAISPDGHTVVFVASDGKQSRLYVRHIGDWVAKPIAGTEDALGAFFSPDGASIAFMSRTGLYRLQLAGGPPTTVFEDQGLPYNTGLEWETDGNIVFSRGGRVPGLWQVPAKGGAPKILLASSDSGRPYLWPRRLPGSGALTFTKVARGHASICVVRDGKVETLIANGSHALYLPGTGDLIFQSEGHLLAVPFDPLNVRLQADPYVVQSDVGNSDPLEGEFDVAGNGTLVYLSPRNATLTWKTRSGASTRLPLGMKGLITFVALAPDGHRAVVALQQGAAHKLFMATLGTDATPTLLTDGWFGLFTPDGSRLLFTSGVSDSRFNIYSMPMDRHGEIKRQTNSLSQQAASSIRGDTFLFNDVGVRDGSPDVSQDVWQQQLDRPQSARPLLDSRENEGWAVFSPDGRWIAYHSFASGTSDIYVRGYPDGPNQRVSPEGGNHPAWNPKGGEIFYQKAGSVYAIRILNGARVGPATRLFERPDTRDRNWDVSPDGTRFLVAESARAPQINIVLNWFEELKAKARNGR